MYPVVRWYPQGLGSRALLSPPLIKKKKKSTDAHIPYIKQCKQRSTVELLHLQMQNLQVQRADCIILWSTEKGHFSAPLKTQGIFLGGDDS